MKNFYSNNQNEFAVNNTVIEQSDLRIYPTQNSNKYVRRHKKIFIAIISLVLVFAIIIAGIVINHNGYEHAEAQVCECRTIIRSLVYSGDDEEEISGNECALAERIKEAQKYSFFLPKDLKEQLKAFEQFQKNFPSKKERDEIFKDCRKLDNDMVAYIDTIDDLILVSTTHQRLARQITNILDVYPTATIIRELYTGTTQNRPHWKKFITQVTNGDTIVFDSVSRMARNSEEGFKDYKSLYESGVNLVFLNEPLIDTSVLDATKSNLLNVSIETSNVAIDSFFKGNIKLIKPHYITYIKR